MAGGEVAADGRQADVQVVGDVPLLGVGRWPLDIGYIANAVDMGLGRADLEGMRIEEFAL